MQIKYPRRQEQTPEQKAHDTQKFGLLDPSFEYKPAVNTDVRKTWMKFGWRPVHEHDIEGEQK